MPCRNVYRVSRPEEKCPKGKEAGSFDQMGCSKERLADGIHASRKSSQMRVSEWNSLFFFSWMENDLRCRLLQRQKSLLASKHWPVGFLFYFCQPIHRFQKCSIDLCSLPFTAQQTTLRGSAQKRTTCILQFGQGLAQKGPLGGRPWWVSGGETVSQHRWHSFRSLIPEGYTCSGATKPGHPNYWACPLEHRRCHKSATTMRSLRTASGELPPLTATREQPARQWRSGTAKNK